MLLRSAASAVARALAALALTLVAAACFGGGGTDDASDAGASLEYVRDASNAAGDAARELTPQPPFDAGNAPYQAEIGVAGGDGGRGFAPLAEGGPIPIGGAGQAGLTARMAIRLRDPDGGPLPDSAVVELVLINAFSGVVAESKPWDIAVELVCDGDVCDQPLVLVEISHLAKLPELVGLPVWIELTVRDAEAPTRILARAQGSGVLDRP